jgi:hypothetical protein
MVSGIVFGLNIPFRGSKFTLVSLAVTYISEVSCRGRHHLTRQLGHREFAREDRQATCSLCPPVMGPAGDLFAVPTSRETSRRLVR